MKNEFQDSCVQRALGVNQSNPRSTKRVGFSKFNFFQQVLTQVFASKLRSTKWCLSSFFLIAISCNLHAQYTVVEIGSIGGIDTVPWRINSRGEIVGFDNVAGNWHAFFYSKGKLIDLHPSSSEQSLAWGINDLGAIVGEHNLPGRISRPFKLENGAMSYLDNIDGTAKSINNLGQITGHYYLTAPDGYIDVYAYLYQSGAISNIGSLGGTITHASDINELGQIVGDSALYPRTPSNSGPLRHAFSYSSGAMLDLGSLGGASNANAVNNSGDVLGTYWFTNASGQMATRPFLYRNGVMVDLCASFGSNVSGNAYDINDKSEAVFNCGTTNILYSNGMARDLSSLIDPNLGWVGVGAFSINNAGQISAQARRATDSIWRAVILNPPGFSEKDLGEPDCVNKAGTNPINIGTGNKYQAETDLSGPTDLLTVTRYYNSRASQSDSVGNNWGLFSAINILSNTSVSVRRPDQKVIYYYLINSIWTPDKDVAHKLAKTANGWQLVTVDNVTENYDVSGRLQSIVQLDGLVQTFTYSDAATPLSVAPVAGLLIRTQDSFNRQLNFTYDSNSRIKTITDPAGGVITYGYDALSNLIFVSYPDGRSKTYHYNESANTSGADLPHALTGITDENGIRFSTYRYDSTGRAYDEDHGGTVAHYNLSYNVDASGNPVSTIVTDPLGTQRTHNFTTILGVVKSTGQTQPCGAGCSAASSATTYDPNGNVASRADFNGNKTCYSYDLMRNLEISRIEGVAAGMGCSSADLPPGGTAVHRTILTGWHPTFRLPVKITEPGRETSIAYDTRGNVTSTTLKDTVTGKTRSWSTTYTYHATVPGVLVQKIDNGPRIDVNDLTTTDYYAPDASCVGGHFGCRGQVKQITNALGHIIRITRYNAHGQPEEIIDPNGLVTTLAYDVRQRLISRVVGTETTGFEYDGVGQLTRLTRADGSTLNYRYDAAHRLTQISDALGNKIVYTLDAMGNTTGEDIVDPAGTLVQTRRSEYDALSRLAKDIGAASQTTQYTYDAVGNPTDTTDPLAHTHTQTYDALNRLAQRVDATGATTRISRDARDNPTAVTNPRAHATQYTYDGLDNLTKEISPDRGTITTTYDDAGNPLIVTDARGAKHTTSYDALNRPIQRSYTTVKGVTATPTTTWLYDQGVNGIGRLTRMNDATGNTVYSYDTQGRLLSTTQTTTFSGVSLAHTRSQSYDPAGRLSTQTYPSGLQISYGYDSQSQGRIASINLNGQPLLSNIAYRPFGAPLSWLWGNGQSYTRSFDADGRLSAYPIGSDTRVLSYDPASRITGFAQTNSIYNRSFSYDPEDRLQTYQNNLGSQTYRYDTTGNRTGIDYDATTYLYTIATTSNRLTQVAGPVVKTYLYDAAGNPTSDGVITFTWDAANRLNKIASGKGGSAVSASYLYNGFGQRLIKTANVLTNAPWRYVYDEAGHLIGEYDKNNVVLQETVWLGDTPVAVVKKTAPSTYTIYFVQTDHLNTPRVILNSANTPIWRWDNSDAFGVGSPDEDPDKDTVKFEYNPRFPGQYFDKETNLHYNGFRDYEPRTGRYVEADPMGLWGGDNVYTYGLNNPLSFIDPLGLEAGVTIWQPVGWGSSSFGHVSTDINGTTYSYGPNGMTTLPTKDYREKNNFRDGAEVKLKLTPQQEAALKRCLSKPQGDYSSTGNNCGSPPQRCLKELGIDTGNQTLPVSLGNRLLDMPVSNGANHYPASKPAKGVNAPWAR